MSTLLAGPVMLVVKATLVLAMAGAITLLLRRRDAAARHLVWTLALAVLLIMPLAALTVPAWRIPLLTLPAVGTPELGGPVTTSYVVPASASIDERAAAPGANEANARVAGSDPGVVGPRIRSAGGLLLLWTIGTTAVLVWLLIGRLGLRSVLRRSPELTGAEWEQARSDAAWLLEVKRRVHLHRSPSAVMPVTWGVLRPVVLLPAEADAWTADRRRIVLLHELAHVARRDCLTQLLAGVACAVYWFHPGVWYAARRMRVERELACDDLVLSAGTPPREYAAHLLELAQRYRAAFRAPLVALHMARPTQLEGRLLTVLSGASGRRPPTRARILTAGVATGLLVLPLSALQPVAAPEPGGSVATSSEEHAADAAANRDDVRAHAADIPRDSIMERDVAARAGELLVLDLRTGGVVEITSWDEDRVRVRARLSGRDWRESTVSVQRSANGVDVVAWQNEGRLSVNAPVFDIRVPRRFNVQLASAGGAITIRNVEGHFRGHTSAGELQLSQIRGEARLSTGRGDIRVSDSELDGRVSTDDGAVTLVNVRGDLRGGSAQAQAAPLREQPAPARDTARAVARRGNITINDSDSIARIVRRLPLTAAAHALVTRDGHVALLLRDSTIVLQLTDRGLENIGSGDVAPAEEDGFLSALVGSMLRGGLRMLLDRGIEYSLADLREARYADGRLILESRDGNDVFGDVSVSNSKVMEDFDPRAARAFASRVNASRARLRR